MKYVYAIFAMLVFASLASAFTAAVGAGCPSNATLDSIIAQCKASGMGYYIYYDEFQCQQASCLEVQNPCPTPGQLADYASRCTQAGKGYYYYKDNQSCEQVSCNETKQCPNVDQLAVSESQCKQYGMASERYYDADKCQQVRCINNTNTTNSSCHTVCTPGVTAVASCHEVCGNQTAPCPNVDQIGIAISKCKDAGLAYDVYYDDRQCQQVSCKSNPTSDCQPSEVVQAMISGCKDKGMDYTVREDTSGCAIIECIPNPCPNQDALGSAMKICRSKGQGYEAYYDDAQCKQIRCVGQNQSTNCTKTVNENGCAQVTCEDGYYYNSCGSQESCRVECSTFTDEAGCSIKKCSDGYYARDCPNQGGVECNTTRDNYGCEIKSCSDGTVSRSCPPVECNGTNNVTAYANLTGVTNVAGAAFVAPPCTSCQTYTDDAGCKVKECADGYKAKDCPNDPAFIECKVFTDERNCSIKECSNGYILNSCDSQAVNEAECNKTVDENGCNITSCPTYYSRECAGKEKVECRSHVDQGCVIRQCTDGYTDKVCAAPPLPPTAAGGQGGNQTGTGGNQTTGGQGNALSAFFQWLAKLFGGQ